MTTLDARRISADALVLMALGLGLLYHAGPWPWMSRTLTIAGAALPAWVLCSATGAPFVTWLALGAIVLAGNLVLPTWHAYAIYADCNAASQLLLTALWAAWARQSHDWLAWLGTAMAGVGAVFLAIVPQLYLKLWLGLGEPIPDPFSPWRTGDYGPLDMLSRVAPWLVGPESMMIGTCALLWLWYGLRPRWQS